MLSIIKTIETNLGSKNQAWLFGFITVLTGNSPKREALEWGWNQEMAKTMFHLVNAYTRAAEYEGLSAEASYRLQKVGGMVLGMVK